MIRPISNVSFKGESQSSQQQKKERKGTNLGLLATTTGLLGFGIMQGADKFSLAQKYAGKTPAWLKGSDGKNAIFGAVLGLGIAGIHALLSSKEENASRSRMSESHPVETGLLAGVGTLATIESLAKSNLGKKIATVTAEAATNIAKNTTKTGALIALGAALVTGIAHKFIKKD